MHRFTSKVADSREATSLATKARQKRFGELMRRFPELAEMRVIDLGGTTAFWQSAAVRPAHVTIVNLEPTPDQCAEGIETVVGDACALAPELTEKHYDLAFSNSVIEHVGGHQRRLEFAREVRSIAPHYWVQTPYRYFPIEPHWVFPGQQFLPANVRAEISRRWKFGHIQSDPTHAMEDALWIELLGVAELRHYFPDGEIYRERFAGVVKSITAVR